MIFARTGIGYPVTMIDWEDACGHLSRRDPVLKELIRSFPGERLVPKRNAFLTLVRAIIGQQISVKAADSIFSRVADLTGRVTPLSVASAGPAALRSCGLSVRKVEYLTALARAFQERSIRPASWRSRSDAEIRAELESLRGIGRWTAEMFLIFHLERPDVLPIGDVGLLRSCVLNYGWEPESIVEALETHAERWVPYRSVAVWYLWRSLDPVPVEY